MEINNLEKKLEEIKRMIYNYEINEIMNKILTMLEEVYKEVNFLKKEKQDVFNQIVKYINISFENKDYLVLSDILEYELKPFLCNINQKEKQ